MKNRKLALLLCLTLLFSVLSPAMAFAAPELDTPVDDPLDPDPYTYINQIAMTLDIETDGSSTSSCNVYVSNTSYHYTVTMDLLKMNSNGTWPRTSIKAWAIFAQTGTADMTDKPYDIGSYGSYRLAVTVDVYNSSNKLVESQTEYGGIVTYSATGVTY